jgi:hypothetical protein
MDSGADMTWPLAVVIIAGMFFLTLIAVSFINRKKP